MPDVSIVIVSWNTRDLLRECLHSIAGTTVDVEVTVVDNASGDGSAEMVRREFPRVRVVANSENVGFGRANNQVLADGSSPFVLVLNPDTTLLPGALERLLAFASARADCGMVAPRVLHAGGRLRVLSAGRQPSLRSLFNHYSGLSRLSGRFASLEGVNLISGVHDDRPREVEWVAGACMLVRREVIDQVGLFTERWFMYAEDMEWCARIRAAGWKVWHLPEAGIVHHVGASQAKRAVGTTVWLEAARGHYHTLSAPSRPRRWLFDAVAMGGLASRAVAYASLAACQPRRRRQWAEQSRIWAMYCRSYARFLAGGR